MNKQKKHSRSEWGITFILRVILFQHYIVVTSEIICLTQKYLIFKKYLTLATLRGESSSFILNCLSENHAKCWKSGSANVNKGFISIKTRDSINSHKALHGFFSKEVSSLKLLFSQWWRVGKQTDQCTDGKQYTKET